MTFNFSANEARSLMPPKESPEEKWMRIIKEKIKLAAQHGENHICISEFPNYFIDDTRFGQYRKMFRDAGYNVRRGGSYLYEMVVSW